MVNARQRAAAKRKRDEELLSQQSSEEEPATLPQPEPRAEDSEPHACIDVRTKSNSKVVEDSRSGGLPRGDKEFELFIGGLTRDCTESSLRAYFEECGKIVYCRVPLNDEGTARGFAFIRFAGKDAVDSALSFDGTTYCGRNIQVRSSNTEGRNVHKEKVNALPAKRDESGLSKCNYELEVYLHGIPPSTTKESLKKSFAKCGEIVNITLPITPDGEAKGIAFIEFTDRSACDKALGRNNTRYGGYLLNVRMSYFNGFEARAKRKRTDKRNGDRSAYSIF